MNKNWLIRTKNNHILGPLSKEKVRELYYSKSIKDEDELCSGNGYWFYIKEKSLVEKYLLGDTAQGFNIVSEATSVLTTDSPIQTDQNNEVNENSVNDELEQSDLLHPEDDDLEYPDLGLSDVGEFNDDEVSDNQELSDIEEVGEIDLEQFSQNEQAQIKPKKKGDFLLYILALLFLVMAVLAFINRKIIISNFISQINIIPKAYAQSVVSTGYVKKKFVIHQ